MPMDLPEAEPPAAVELDRDRGLLVRWPDGALAEFELVELRRNCPCAECRGVREAGEIPGPADPAGLHALDAELVGAWGIQLRWSDGHDTGIFAWSLLRAWAGV